MTHIIHAYNLEPDNIFWLFSIVTTQKFIYLNTLHKIYSGLTLSLSSLRRTIFMKRISILKISSGLFLTRYGIKIYVPIFFTQKLCLDISLSLSISLSLQRTKIICRTSILKYYSIFLYLLTT